MKKQHSFKTRARVINQLGEQLIKNEAIALLELIKNSYDADASFCNVTMYSPESKEKGIIVVKDNGEGMDEDILSKVWLEIGTSFKEDLRNDESENRTHKYKRLRLGEKGIGRLGVHRLGKEIEITTRKSGKGEYVLRIDWDNILKKKYKYIEDLPIDISEQEPRIFKRGSGTKIVVKRLRVPWTRKMARDCARSVLSLNSPFDSNDSFRVTFKIPESKWLDGILKFSDVEDYKLFSFDVSMVGNEISSFTYKFTPWSTMKKLSSREVTIEDIEALTRMQYKEGRNYKDIDLGGHKIGTVRFKGVIFDRDTRTLDLGVQDKSGLKKYLDTNGGVRVFRDNMRVLDYGEPGNDWLDLGGRRVNMPTKRISNNIILGAVYLDRENSDDLQEKANREGFVENDAYWELWRAIRFAMDRIESLRKTDKDLLRKFYGPQKTSEPVITSISELKDVIEKSVKDVPVRTKIHKYLDRIESEYESITNNLIKSAGAGLNLIMVIHQIDKIIKEIKIMLRKKASLDIVEDRVKALSALIEGYSILVKKSDKKSRCLEGIVEQSMFNMGFRFEAHNIDAYKSYHDRNKMLQAICSEGHVLSALMNLLDNSIWWLGYSKTKSPSVFVDISDQMEGYVSIVVADNGPGFTKPTDEIIKPFVSDKPGGMGIGLHLTQQIMESLGGKLIFPEMEIFDIPKKYSKGAKIALAFKRGDN